jgi:hypothetical protein
MPYDRLTDAEIEAGKFILASTGAKIQSNQDFFAGQLGTLAAVQISNGSFEIASDAAQPNLPDNWTLTRYANGVFVLDTTNPRHGGKIAKFTHPSGAGNGGGQLLSDYFECTPDRGMGVEWVHWATNAGVHVTVQIDYYDDSQVFVSSETLFDASSGIVAVANRYSETLTVPATARYFRVLLIGGDTDTDPGVSTDIYFDDVRTTSRRAYGAGDLILAAADTVRTQTVNFTASKFKEIRVVKGGTLRITYDLTVGDALDWGRIYKNGSPIGIQRTANGSYSEDIPDWQPGDLVQFYLYFSSGAPSPTVANFRVKASADIIENVVID